MVQELSDESTCELIGRDREAAEIRTLVLRSRVVLVYGPAGIGKTSLVLSACRAAAREGVIPDVVVLSMAGITSPREALERTARALGEPRPEPATSALTDALASLLARAPRTVVWDDFDERSAPLSDLVRRFWEQEGRARIVVVSRRFITAREATLRAPAFQLKPLAHADALRLVQLGEQRRGRSLADDLVEATGGNPLLIRLALAQTALPRIGSDTADALRHEVETHAQGLGRRILELLIAADAALDEEEVVRAVGKGARDAIDDLRKHLLVVREGNRIAVPPTAVGPTREVLGDPDEGAFRLLAQIAERGLAARAHDDTALLVATRAQLELGEVATALRLVQEHPVARAAMPSAAMEGLLRAIAARGADHAAVALRVLAREHLRMGDFEASRRTLDELPRPKTREEAERIALLRAESHIRGGEPAAAQHALDAIDAIDVGDAKKKNGKKPGSVRPKPLDESPGVVLTRAQLAVLRGELIEARQTLEALAPLAVGIPQLEARRCVEIAATHLYEEGYERTHEWTARARAAQKAGVVPVEPIVTILDVHAMLGLGEVDRVFDVLQREARGRPHGQLLELAALIRRGEHRRALEDADVALAALGRHADLLYRSVLARDLVRACIGTGELARAERMLRLVEAGAGEPGLAALQPFSDTERAHLAEAEGDLERATLSIDRASSKIPASPFISVDRAFLHGESLELPLDAPAVARAYAALRSGELALMTGKLTDAIDVADAAERHYMRAHLWHETARARLVRAEALARLAREATDADRPALVARALDAVALCEEVASPQGYVPILVACGLARAVIAEARGDLFAFREALGEAVRIAGEGLDTALANAALRVGITLPVRQRPSARRPYEALVERLGLARHADVVWRIGPRAYLTAMADEPPERVACVVDLDERLVRAGTRALDLPEQRIALLSVLAEAGDTGISLEDIFARVWGGAFHPLRHRNAVYVALARLKESLRPISRDLRIAHRGERYHLSGPLPVAVRRKADGGGVRAALGQDDTPAA